MEERLEQLQAKLEGNSGLGEKMFALETAVEVQSLLRAEGMEFTIDEIMTLREALVKTLEKKENGELSDEDLEEVAGGFVVTLIAAIVLGFATTIGTVHGATQGKW